ncbi:diguanylate cyclase [Liberiplasma polymorphum]|uniref:diguanylate cyclase n=1 Tax=Liberiplasma polymorphum TaxID=3374570 RepID=UPI0037709CEC
MNLSDKQKLFRRYSIIIIGIFIVYIFTMVSVYNTINTEKNNYINTQQTNFSDAVNATNVSYKNFTDYVYADLITSTNLLEKLNEVALANELEKTTIRNELYVSLLDIYELLLESNIHQLHIHLPSGESFLRFHNPTEFGDYLFDIRETVRIANTERVFASGFEEGKTFSGYRFVYPLFYEDTHVGSIEISLSIATLMETFYNLFPTRDNFFLLDKALIQEVSFEDYLIYYSDCIISDNYVVDNIVNNQFDDLRYHFDKSSYDHFFTVHQANLALLMEQKADFYYYTEYQGKNYILLFQDLRNVKNNHVGYMVIIYEDNLLITYSNQLRISATFITGFFLALIVMFVIYGIDKLKLQDLSTKDTLTGISNRFYFRKIAKIELEKARRYNKELSIIMLDIDFFKHINDNYGHKKGDEVLKNLVQAIQSKIRITDIFARWGGEEFAILLPETDLKKAVIVAEKLRVHVKGISLIEEEIITVSFRVSAYNPDIETVDQLIGLSDEALYRAKNSGRNCVKT